MAERDYLVTSLAKELLGPRGGMHEMLTQDRDPRSEYVTGVLAPIVPEQVRDDPDADVDEVIEEVSDDENDGAEGAIVAPPSAFSPALDPKSQPRSIGLSFVVTADSGSTPSLDICATWARYLPDASTGGWQRQPQSALRLSEPVATDQHWRNIGPDVDLYLRVRPQPTGGYRVSLYFVNQRAIAAGNFPKTEDYVFQPQIRVHCCPGTRLLPVFSPPPTALSDPLAYEDAQLAMLYRQRVAFARGHLCGATWKDIDPERPHPTISAPPEAPFAWTDAGATSATARPLFSPADVRTELLPCYPIESPEMDWLTQFGSPPTLDPLALADTWQPADIRNALEPLVQGYRRWIQAQRQVLPSGMPQQWVTIAQDNLKNCDDTARRMQEGIEWLVRDEDARLAFCFANRAIALQSTWGRGGQVVPWRTFQLAFILLNIASLADPGGHDRAICDLLWFPTGGGKTEAYLGLAAFSLALRRRRALQGQGGEPSGAGVSVLSRYTLRLLTIQQFRRALGIITACEVLRVERLGQATALVGWRPKQCSNATSFLWGGVRFSAGLWVGGNVTPNNVHGFEFRTASGAITHVAGAIDILQGVSDAGYDGPNRAVQAAIARKKVTASGEPAQVLTCPVCRSLLAVPAEGLAPGQHTIHFLVKGSARRVPLLNMLNTTRIQVSSAAFTAQSAPDVATLSLTFTVSPGPRLQAREVDDWWYKGISRRLPAATTTLPELLAARPSRPGYILCTFANVQGANRVNSFEIYCPDPACALNNTPWAEQVPVSVASTGTTVPRTLPGAPHRWLPPATSMVWQQIPEALRWQSDPQVAERTPIPAYTVDDQVYHRCPSLVIATVDKFAQLAFQPKAGTMFGNVTHYHARWGYYREGCPPSDGGAATTGPADHARGYNAAQKLHIAVPTFLPPDLIIQDELHLLEGPLGSMVGLYETVIDALAERYQGSQRIRPKYVASTATVRQAGNQVQALFDRQLSQFPPSATTVDDRFFARTSETHPLESARAGRLYVAVAAPGKGAQTPIVRIWTALLQAAYERQQAGGAVDEFWTLVGYFNALRELAGAAALYRQDIRERIGTSLSGVPRPLSDEPMELSSRTNSLNLPGMLERLALPWSEDAMVATSMFGTGVDVDRLGLMVVHGQPKTTSAYIQATGRVGRQTGGLIVTFFRASRPRDLDHYEFFTGYHRMLYRFVEPITVTPYAPRARERGLGPLAVALLRQARAIGGTPVGCRWQVEQRLPGAFYSEAILMATQRRSQEVAAIAPLLEDRAQQQPPGRRPAVGTTATEAASELDRWAAIATAFAGPTANDRFVYNEPSMLRLPQRGVVLGDEQHQLNQLPVAYENTPTSLRDVEGQTQFKG